MLRNVLCMTWEEPCPLCKLRLLAAGHLRGQRLGRLERKLLTATVRSGIYGSGAGRAMQVPRPRTSKAQAAQRRAISSLRAKGLVADVDGEERIYAAGRLRRRIHSIRATSLGRLVVQNCADELAEGSTTKSIRWSHTLPKIKRALLDECGCLDERRRSMHS